MADIGSLVAKVGLNSSEFDRGIVDVTKSLNKLPAASNNASSGFGGMGMAAAGAAGVIAGVMSAVANKVMEVGSAAASAAGSFVAWGFQLASEAETASVNFEVMLGSAEKAKKVMAELKQFAAATPFSFGDLRETSQTLLAFQVDAEKLVPTMRVLGDLSLGNANKMKELSMIYGQSRATGEVHWDDVRQLANRSIPVIEEFAKQMGVGKEEVKKLVEQGKIGFPQLHNALIDLTSAGGMFAGGMEKASQTIAGRWSTMQDSIADFALQIADSIAETFNVGDGINGFATMIDLIKEQGIPLFKEWLYFAKQDIFMLLDWGKNVHATILEIAGFSILKLKEFIDAVAPHLEKLSKQAAKIAGLFGKKDLAKSLSGFSIDTTQMGKTGTAMMNIAHDTKMKSTEQIWGEWLKRNSGKAAPVAPLDKLGTGKQGVGFGQFFADSLTGIGKLGKSAEGGLGGFISEMKGNVGEAFKDINWKAFTDKEMKTPGGTKAVEGGSSEYYSLLAQRERGKTDVPQKQLAELVKIGKGIAELVGKDTGKALELVASFID